jgi:hypothetical protein
VHAGLLQHGIEHRLMQRGGVSDALATAWQQQIAWCDKGGSPFTARVLEATWADWLAGGALRELLPDWPGDPLVDAVSLRVAGALHSLVLEGIDPLLAANYPPARSTFDPVCGPDAVRQALRAHRDRIADYLRGPPQTNEIGRSAALLCGFGLIAARTGWPLALRELGASAGLNLLWNRYRYELGVITWGDPASPVVVRSEWRGTAPAIPAAIALASAQGCDTAPIDLDAPHAAQRLASYVWPDQAERLQRLRAAIAFARSLQVRVERIDAAEFVAREVAGARAAQTTVIYHSLVWGYLSPATRRAIRTSIEQAGARATHEAPLAWLRLESPDTQTLPQLTLDLWPGSASETLAEVHPHGQFVHWGKSAMPT